MTVSTMVMMMMVMVMMADSRRYRARKSNAADSQEK
jgi:hypothetical protein